MFKFLFILLNRKFIRKADKLIECGDSFVESDLNLIVAFSVINEAIFNESFLEFRKEFKEYKELYNRKKECVNKRNSNN